MFAALFLHLWRLILLGGLVLLFWGTGAKVLRKFNFKFQTFSEEFIFGFAIGAIGWSFLIYFLGLVGLAQEIYFRFVFVVGLILVIPEINNFIDRTAKIFKSFQKQFSWRRLFQNQNYWFLLIIMIMSDFSGL